MSTDLERSLRSAFTAAADTVPTATDPVARTSRAVARSRTRRRTAVAGLAAAAVVVGLAGTTDTFGLRPPVLRGEQVAPAGPTGPVTEWPLRGDLAGDADAVATAREALGRFGQTVRLVYVGEVGGRTVAVGVGLVEGQDGENRVLVAAGDPGVPPAQWRGTPGAPAADLRSVAVGVQGTDARSGLLVLTGRGTQVAWSPRATVDADGTLARTFADADPVGGVAVVDLGRRALGPVSVRLRAGRSVEVRGLDAALTDWSAVPLDERVAQRVSASPACGGAADPAEVSSAVTQTLFTRDGVEQPRDVTALWCRSTPDGVLAAFVVTLADGSAYRSTLRVLDGPDGTSSTMSDEGTPVAGGREGALAAPAVTHLLTDDGPRTRLAVHAPGAAQVQYGYSAQGPGLALVASAPVDGDGFALLDVPRGITGDARDYAVVLLDAAGAELRRVPAYPQVTDLLAREVDGPVSDG